MNLPRSLSRGQAARVGEEEELEAGAVAVGRGAAVEVGVVRLTRRWRKGGGCRFNCRDPPGREGCDLGAVETNPCWVDDAN